jgi:hypothetical protein
VALVTNEMTVAHARFTELAEVGIGVAVLLIDRDEAVDISIALVSLVECV